MKQLAQVWSRFSLSLFVLLLLVPPALARDPATVVRVVDGDTLANTLNGKQEKVRLIGVDTPEKFDSDKLRRDVQRTGQDEATLKALGQQASEFTKQQVHPGDTVQLEYGQESRDKYHRLLAFVWLPDGRMLNETIICEGYIWSDFAPVNDKHGNRGRAYGGMAA